MVTQPKSDSLDYMIDPTSRNINRLFVLLLEDDDNDPTIDSFGKYYMPLVEIKDFSTLIDNKAYFDKTMRNKEKTYEKLVELSRNEDYTTGNLLEYLYHQRYYKLISRDLLR